MADDDTQPPPSPSGIPDRIGPYTVTGRLGSGGMGTVYSATGDDGTPVAVKVIRADFAADDDYRRRFAREVEAARRVRSDHVAVVIDADVDARAPWFASELVEGPSVADLVRTSGPLDTDAVVALAVDLAKAVAALHAAGVIHRDIKPANVVIGATGAKLVDFGVARAAGTADLTQAGAIIGSPAFMAPEQQTGRQVGPPADIYGWAATVTFAATGQPPAGAPAQPLQLPAVLGRLTAAGLSTDAAARPTAAALVFELLDAAPAVDDTVLNRLHDTALQPAAARAPVAEPVPVRRRARWPLLVAAVLVAVAAAGGIALTSDDDPPATATTGTTETTISSAEEQDSSPSTRPTTTAATAGLPDVVGSPIVDSIEEDIAGDGVTAQVDCPPDVGTTDWSYWECTASSPGLDSVIVWIVMLDNNRWSYDLGSGIPWAIDEIAPPGALCRDIADAGHPFFYATLYWVADNRPERMDADGNGIPCETIYARTDIAEVWDPEH